MTGTLARVEGTSVDELVQISETMQEFIRTEDREARETTIERLTRKPGVIRRLFPTAFERETQRIDVARLRALATSKEKLFDLYTEVQLEIARKRGDALIASVGMDLQTKLTAFATEKMDEITITLAESKRKFIRNYLPQVEEAEAIRDHPDLYKDVVDALAQQRQVYFSTMDKLLQGFVASLETRVGRA